MTRKLVVLFVVLAVAISGLLAIAPATAQSSEFAEYSASAELTEPHADIFRLYWAFFDREPDVGGAQYWVDEFDQCASLLDITWSFSNSPEFIARYSSLSHSEYVDLVYNNVLDRAPDDDGRKYWLYLLNSGQILQAEVMLYFSVGPEFRGAHPLPSDGRPYDGCEDPGAPATTVSVTTTAQSQPDATPTTVGNPVTTGSTTTAGPLETMSPTTGQPETTTGPPETTIPTTPSSATTASTTTTATTAGSDAYFANCAAVRAAGAAPIRAGQPGYRLGLDRDGDGVGCES